MEVPQIDQPQFRRALARAIIFPLIALLLFVTILLWQLEDMLAASILVDHSDEAIAQAHATQNLLVDMETGLRGYLITGDETFLAPYRTGLRDTAATIARLRTLLAGHPDPLAQLSLVEEAITVWHRVGADPEIAARQSGDEAAAARAVGSGAGMAAFDALREDVDMLQQQVDAAQRSTTEEADDASALLDRVLIGAGILALGLLALGGALFGRWVLLPLRVLRAQLNRVTRGELQGAIEPSGPMEIAVVGEAAEAMRQRIVTELDAARAARDGLAQRVPVVTGLEDQLRPPRYVELPGLRAATAVHAAEGVLAGDVAHVLPLAPGRLALVVIDVSGHGAEAGLVAVRLKHLVSAALTLGHGPAVAMRAACDSFTDERTDYDERFATCLIVDVDAGSGQVCWANAGHPPALVVGVRGGRLAAEVDTELGPTGPLLSSLGGSWQEQQASIEPGQVLLAYSDGLTEARDESGALLGITGVGAALAGLAADPGVVVDSCVAAAREHAADWDRDDVTVVAVTIGLPVPQPAHSDDRSEDPVF